MDATRSGKPLREMQNISTKKRRGIKMESEIKMNKELDMPLLMAVVNKVNKEDKETLLSIIYNGVSEDKHDDLYQLAYLMLDEIEQEEEE